LGGCEEPTPGKRVHEFGDGDGGRNVREGGGWGIPMANFPLTVTLGGIAEKPGVVEGRIEVREYLDVTVSFDHTGSHSDLFK
jgi:hypothetical protein